MTNRRHYHKVKGRGGGRYVRLDEYLLASAAWRSLDCVDRMLYVEIARRYRGPNSNNGKIPYSVREAAAALGVGKSTANRAFDRLIDRGFIVMTTDSGFNVKGRVSREWLLTEYADDTKAHSTPSKLFMRWQPGNPFHGATTGTDSATSGTEMYLERDTAARNLGLRT